MDKVIIITGTSRGIGKYLAQKYLQQGNIVYGISRSKQTISCNNYYHYCFNISNQQQIIKMIKQIYKKHKRADVLINNAGIASMNHMSLTTTQKSKQIIDVNFIGTFNVTKQVSKIMIKNKGGRIVNFSSIAVPMAIEGQSIYGASKSAIQTFTRIIAKQLGHFGITVNCIGPNPIKTDIIKGVSQDNIQKIIKQQCIKRYGKYQDVKNVIDFFISQKSDMITGQIIYLGGIS